MAVLLIQEKRDFGPSVRRLPIILANPDREAASDKNKQKPQQQTTIILRNRDASTFSNQRTASSTSTR